MSRKQVEDLDAENVVTEDEPLLMDNEDDYRTAEMNLAGYEDEEWVKHQEELDRIFPRFHVSTLTSVPEGQLATMLPNWEANVSQVLKAGEYHVVGFQVFERTFKDVYTGVEELKYTFFVTMARD